MDFIIGIELSYFFINAIWFMLFLKDQWVILEVYDLGVVELELWYELAFEVFCFKVARAVVQEYYLEWLNDECVLLQIRIFYQFTDDFGFDVIDVISCCVDNGVDWYMNQVV